MKFFVVLAAILSIQLFSAPRAQASFIAIIPECNDPQSDACRYRRAKDAEEVRQELQERAKATAYAAKSCTAAMHRKFGKKIASFAYDSAERTFWTSSTTICQCAVNDGSPRHETYLSCYPLAQ